MITLNKTPVEQVARRDLWIAVSIGVTFAAYHLVTTLSWGTELLRFKAYTLLSTSLMFIIFGLLWVAYRRWREAEAHRREMQVIMRSITTEAILLVDPKRRILACNEAVRGLFGREPEDVVGTLTDGYYGDRRVDKTRPGEIRESLDEDGWHRGRAVGRRANGEEFPLEITTERLKGRFGAVLVLHDITQRERAEQSILEAKADVERAYAKLKETEQMRDSLVHMIVHDMRTPLQVMLTMESFALDSATGRAPPASPEEHLETLQELKAQTNQLIRMANGVLDVSRMESGRMALKPAQVDVRQVAGAALESMAALLRNHRVARDDQRGGASAWCDGELVGRIITNLLSNAAKYTPAGRDIALRLADEADFVRVEVQDNGPGIPAEFQARVFDKFTEAGSAAHQKAHSSGLGLTFCKLAVESQGGRIGLVSNAGLGSTFWFTLPRRAPGAG